MPMPTTCEPCPGNSSAFFMWGPFCSEFSIYRHSIKGRISNVTAAAWQILIGRAGRQPYLRRVKAYEFRLISLKNWLLVIALFTYHMPVKAGHTGIVMDFQ